MINKIKYKYPFSYVGNLVWPILFLLLFLPVGLLMLLLNVRYTKNSVVYGMEYRGSKSWLYFWTFVFCPFAIILGAIKGFNVVESSDCQAELQAVTIS